MSVVLNKRNESEFKTETNLKNLRNAVTELIFNDFGYSKYKRDSEIEHFKKSLNKNCKDPEATVARMMYKNEVCTNWFVECERNAVLLIMRTIVREFDLANSIFVSETIAMDEEYIERRMHLDKAISYCSVLYREIEYALETLPVDANKFTRFQDLIDKQISLFKGIRKADNRIYKKMKERADKKNKK